jgi:predicted house-cleaning NTP pyrophosphatase (Maf/HAM1 superfamily)
MSPRINGSYSGIMGLPLFETMQLIEHLGNDSTTAC